MSYAENPVRFLESSSLMKPKQIGVFSLEMSEIMLYTSRYLSIFG